MPTTLNDEAAIVGIGQTTFSKNSGVSELQLACEAVSAAIDDAGLDPTQVDGMTTFTMDTTDDIEVARAVGIGGLTFESRIPYGGGACIGLLHQAAMAVATGSAKYVVCYRALNGRSGQRYSEGVSGDLMTSDAIHWSWYMPFGLLTPASWVAMFAQRYMHQTGTKSTDFAQVALSTRKHAVNNPHAFYHQRPLSMEDHQSSRMIVDPLRLFDCCQETDGGCACIVTTPERARDLAQAGGRDPRRRPGGRGGPGADDELLPPGHHPAAGDGLGGAPGLRDVGARAARHRCGGDLRRLLGHRPVAARVLRLLRGRRGQGLRPGRSPGGGGAGSPRTPTADSSPRPTSTA